MKIEDECQIKAIYMGKEYHLCSDDCRKASAIAPEEQVEEKG